MDIQVIEVVLDKKSYFINEVLGQATEPVISDKYIINAFGNRCYIKCNSREVAQRVVDEYYGKGFYVVKSIRGAKGAENVSVRSSETRRGQYVQREKAKILNG